MTAKKKSSFRGKVGTDAQRQKRSGASYGYLNLPKGVNVFSPKPGSKNVLLDFLPYIVSDPKHPDKDEKNGIALVDSLWYKRPFLTHRNIGADNDAVVCLNSVKKPCPICEHMAKMKVKEDVDKDDIKALKPSKRNLYVIVPLNSKDHEVKPHVFDISQYLFQELLNEELEDNEDYEVFPDIEEGLTLKLRFDSTTIAASKPFAEAGRIDFLERDETYDESILDEVPDLDTLLNILSYDELNNKFLELEDEEDGGKLENVEEEEEKPKRHKRTIPPQRQPHEEEEEEKPTRRRKVIEEEEEKPVRKSDKEKCPHGHKFGVDTEKFDECDTCDVWENCDDEKRANK